MSFMGWQDDQAFYRSYRVAWAKYYEACRETHAARLRTAELAAHVELLDLPAEHPALLEAQTAMEAVGPLEAIGVRAYVHWLTSPDLEAATS